MISVDIQLRRKQVNTERLTHEVTDFVDGGSAQVVLLLGTAWDGSGENTAAVQEEVVRTGFNILWEVAVLQNCPLAIHYFFLKARHSSDR